MLNKRQIIRMQCKQCWYKTYFLNTNTQDLDVCLCQLSFSQNNTDMAILFYQRVLQGKQIHILYGLTYLSSVSVYKKGRSDDGTIQKYSLTG